jgi:RimJ/RimL family protein N-acetyltransferase
VVSDKWKDFPHHSSLVPLHLYFFMPQRPNVPTQLETERLILRAPELSDVPFIYQAIKESIKELKPWMPWATEDYTLEACEENLRGAIAKYITREDFRICFLDKTTGRLLGNSGLHRIGYWCRTSETGEGYVTEVVRGLTKMCFEKLNAARVEIRCDDLNQKSAAVAERCGFGLEGILKNNERNPKGELCSTRIYALTRLEDLK